MTAEELLEAHWGRALVHESGHALMAALEDIHCQGIFYNKTVSKFCAVTDLPDESAYTKKHYLFRVASSAAQLVISGDEDELGAKSDRLPFQNAGGPSLQDTLNEARIPILEHETELKRMVSALKAKCLEVDLILASCPCK